MSHPCLISGTVYSQPQKSWPSHLSGSVEQAANLGSPGKKPF